MELWWPTVLPFLSAAAAVALLYCATSKTLSAKLHWIVQLGAALLSLPFLVMTLLLLVVVIGCDFHGPIIGSPDGRHVARVQGIDGGALGGSAVVIVRHSWSPVWRRVYGGFGFMPTPDTTNPELHWLDNHDLLIIYEPDGSRQWCLDSAGPIKIRCIERTALEPDGKNR